MSCFRSSACNSRRESEITDGEEELVEAILKNKTLNRAGGFCKVGEHMVNSSGMIKAYRIINKDRQ